MIYHIIYYIRESNKKASHLVRRVNVERAAEFSKRSTIEAEHVVEVEVEIANAHVARLVEVDPLAEVRHVRVLFVRSDTGRRVLVQQYGLMHVGGGRGVRVVHTLAVESARQRAAHEHKAIEVIELVCSSRAQLIIIAAPDQQRVDLEQILSVRDVTRVLQVHAICERAVFGAVVDLDRMFVFALCGGAKLFAGQVALECVEEDSRRLAVEMMAHLELERCGHVVRVRALLQSLDVAVDVTRVARCTLQRVQALQE